jgi:hypothetical protein
MHGLIFETSICNWQDQPGCYLNGFGGEKKTQNVYFSLHTLVVSIYFDTTKCFLNTIWVGSKPEVDMVSLASLLIKDTKALQCLLSYS